jgi:CubicO group peptidase (beta-lactamase class C family)
MLRKVGQAELTTWIGLLNGLLEAYPVAPPARNPVYSTISFSLSALALRDVTSKNYSQLLDEYLGQPLGLKNTGESPGEDSKAVIPPVDNNWGADYGLNAP